MSNLGLNSLGVALPSVKAPVLAVVAASLFLSTNFGAKLIELDFKDLKRSCDAVVEEIPAAMEDMGPLVGEVAPKGEAVPIPAPVMDAAAADVVALGGTSTVRRDGSYARSLFIFLWVESLLDDILLYCACIYYVCVHCTCCCILYALIMIVELQPKKFKNTTKQVEYNKIDRKQQNRLGTGGYCADGRVVCYEK